MKRLTAAIALSSLALTACSSLPSVQLPGLGSSEPEAVPAPVQTEASTRPDATSAPRIWARADDGMITHVPSGATCPPQAGEFVFTGLEETIFTDTEGNPLSDGICQYQLRDGSAQLTTYIYELPGVSSLEEMRSTFQLLNQDYVVDASREPSEICQGNLLRLLGLLGVPEPDAACLVFTLDGGEQGQLPSLATVTKAGNWAIKVRSTAAAETDVGSAAQDAAFAYTATQVQNISAAAFGQ